MMDSVDEMGSQRLGRDLVIVTIILWTNRLGFKVSGELNEDLRFLETVG